MKALTPAPGEREKMRALAELVASVRYFEDRFTPPVEGCQNSPFGVQRLHNGKATGSYHRGADQRGAEGTPVRAPASGVVAVAEPKFQVNGGTVGLDHGQGLTSHYIHLSGVAVTEGERVKQGDVIGYVGSTGFATGPHLHWGTVVHGTPVDPNEFVTLTPCPAPAKKR
jgi:murein DD-endopeptidase MepM/ murein hydrolase activator NlpD